MPFRSTSTLIFKGKVFSLYSEKRGKQQFDMVAHPGGSAIVAIDNAKNLLLVKQYRRACDLEMLELPAGLLEEGEDPLDCAQRELQEETGFFAKDLRPLGGIFTSPGFCSEYIYLFFGRDLVEKPLKGDEHEKIELVKLPILDVEEMVNRGKIRDAKTIVGVLRCTQLLRKEGLV